MVAILIGKKVHGEGGWLHTSWLGDQRENVCQVCGRDPSEHRVELDGGGRRAVCVSEPRAGWVRPGFVRYDVPGLGAVQLGVIRNEGQMAEALGAYSVVNGTGAVVNEVRKDGSVRYDYDEVYVVPREVLAAACGLADARLAEVLASVA